MVVLIGHGALIAITYMFVIYRPLFGLLVLVLPVLAHADEGVLIEHVPASATDAQLIAVVKECLIARKWQIDAVDATSVRASIEHSQITAELRVYVADRTLRYEESARTKRKPGTGNPAAGGGTLAHDTETPARWIEYLRRDVAKLLATIPDTPK